MVYLFYEENRFGYLKYDAVSVTGYVDGNIFVVTDNEEMYNADGTPLESILLDDDNRNNVFESMGDACDFLLKNYGQWAMWHYIKNMDEFA